MIVAVKRLVVAAVAVALIAGCAVPGSPGYRTGTAPQPATPSAPVSAPPAPCPRAGVLLRADATDAAMGLRALGVVLLNCGHEDYRLDGYPVVRALDEKRGTLAVKVLRGTAEIAGPMSRWDGKPRPIILRPGQEAVCAVVWRNTYTDIRQPPVNAPFLRMAPAPGRPGQVVVPDGPLDLGSTGRLGVSPWFPAEPASRTTPAAPPATPPATNQPSIPPDIL